MQGHQRLREMCSAGETAFGVWCTIGSSFTAELAASAGPDYVSCDQQHGVIDYGVLVSMFQAIRAGGSTPLTRVVQNDPGAIMKALDAGAAGVIVPMVSTAAQGAQAVMACRYPPTGIRSFGPVRASVVLGSSDVAELQRSLCLVMIETAEGLENVDAIAGAPGVDGIYIGPADLSLGLGLAPAFDRPEPEFKAAIRMILEACQRHDIIPGIQCTGGAMARKYQELGFRMITVASDASLLRQRINAELALARGDEVATGAQGVYS